MLANWLIHLADYPKLLSKAAHVSTLATKSVKIHVNTVYQGQFYLFDIKWHKKNIEM